MTSVGGSYTQKDADRARAGLAEAVQAMHSKRLIPAGLVVLAVLGAAFVGAYVWDGLMWPDWVWIGWWTEPAPWYAPAVRIACRILRTHTFGAVLLGGGVLSLSSLIENLRPKKGPPGSPIGSDHVWPRNWSFTLTPEALISEDGGLKSTVQWAAVDAIYPSGEFWTFVCQTRPDFVDRRCFADLDAERAFLAEALSYMTEAARARSVAAAAFVGG